MPSSWRCSARRCCGCALKLARPDRHRARRRLARPERPRAPRGLPRRSPSLESGLAAACSLARRRRLDPRRPSPFAVAQHRIAAPRRRPSRSGARFRLSWGSAVRAALPEPPRRCSTRSPPAIAARRSTCSARSRLGAPKSSSCAIFPPAGALDIAGEGPPLGTNLATRRERPAGVLHLRRLPAVRLARPARRAARRHDRRRGRRRGATGRPPTSPARPSPSPRRRPPARHERRRDPGAGSGPSHSSPSDLPGADHRLGGVLGRSMCQRHTFGPASLPDGAGIPADRTSRYETNHGPLSIKRKRR